MKLPIKIRFKLIFRLQTRSLIHTGFTIIGAIFSLFPLFLQVDWVTGGK